MKKMSPAMCLLVVSSMAYMACGPEENNDSPDGPIDITNYDFTTDQVLEDVFEEEGAIDYYATDEMSVDAKLTIKPGVVIAFEKPSGFNVSTGALIVEGSAEAGVLFRERSEGQGWLGVSIVSEAPHDIDNLTIEDAGVDPFLNNKRAAALSFGRDTNPVEGTISGLTIIDSKGAGFFAGAASTFTASGVTVQGSAEEAFELESFAQLGMLGADTKASNNGEDIALVTDIQVVNSSVAIDLPELPAHIENSTIIAEDNTLSLAAGTELYFAKDTYLSIAGTIAIQGSEQDPAVLGAISNMPGGWAGLWIYTQKANTISNAVIENGGGAMLDFVTDVANIVIGDGINLPGKVTITDSVIRGSAGYGIFGQTFDAAEDISVMNTTYEDNASGDIGFAE